MVVYCGVWTCMEGEGGTIASGALRRVRLGVMLRKSFFRSRVEFSRNPPYYDGATQRLVCTALAAPLGSPLSGLRRSRPRSHDSRHARGGRGPARRVWVGA